MSAVDHQVVEQKIRQIYNRIGWVHMRAMLGGLIDITAQGVNPFIEKVLQKLSSSPQIADVIKNFHRETIVGGSLYCKIFKFEPAQIASLISQLNSKIIENSVHLDYYPHSVPLDLLSDIEQKATLVDKIRPQESDQLHKFIFASKGFLTVNKEISKEALRTDEQFQYLSENGGRISIKSRVALQVFNSIIICEKHNIVMLCVDCSELTPSESHAQFIDLERVLKSILGNITYEPLNLFPKIESLYKDVDGYVQYIGFVTGDGNSSYLRLKKGMTCVKTDSYHVAGSSVVGDLVKFEIEKSWVISYSKVEDKSYPLNLKINGRRSMIENANEKLVYVLFDKCPSSNDIRFLIDKIMMSGVSV